MFLLFWNSRKYLFLLWRCHKLSRLVSNTLHDFVLLLLVGFCWKLNLFSIIFIVIILSIHQNIKGSFRCFFYFWFSFNSFLIPFIFFLSSDILLKSFHIYLSHAMLNNKNRLAVEHTCKDLFFSFRGLSDVIKIK